MESPPGSPRTELATTTTAGSYGRPILASMMGGDTCGPASGLEGDNEGLSLSALQASHEALPAEIDVGWRGAQYCDDGGAVASAERFSTTVRLRSPPGSRNDGKRASSRASPPYYTAPSNAAAGTPTALGTSGRSSPAEAIIEREGNDVRAKTPATAASLFASTFSGLGEGHQAARRSPAALDGGASHPGGRSPMSARVDVLQNILAPVEMAEDGLARPNSCVVSPAVTEGRASDEAVFAKMLTMPAPEGKGGGGGIECGEITDSSAERLLERSSETGSRNTIERHERTRPGLSNESDDIQQVGATERPQTPEAKEADDLRPISLRARSGADASTSALDGGPERKAGSRSITDELDAMEQVHFGGVKGLSRPSSYSARNGERWDKQKAGPRLTTGERFDELEELEVRERQHFTQLRNISQLSIPCLDILTPSSGEAACVVVPCGFGLCEPRAVLLSSGQGFVHTQNVRACWWVACATVLNALVAKVIARLTRTRSLRKNAGRKALRSARALAVLSCLCSGGKHKWFKLQRRPSFEAMCPRCALATRFNSAVLIVLLIRQRKEIALLDLEESSHSEFGSVVLRYRDRAKYVCTLCMTTIVYLGGAAIGTNVFLGGRARPSWDHGLDAES